MVCVRRFVSFSDCQAYKVKARLHKKGVKTSSPAGKAKEQQPQPGRLIKSSSSGLTFLLKTIQRWVRLGDAEDDDNCYDPFHRIRDGEL